VVHDGDLTAALARWHLDLPAVRALVYRAPTPRERERWHALWLLARGWTIAGVAAALERDAHTIGDWRARFCRDGPGSIAFERSGGSPRPQPRPTGPAEGGGAGGRAGAWSLAQRTSVPGLALTLPGPRQPVAA
jgi:hypothetical protein